MNRVKYVSFFFLLINSLLSCAQTKNGVKKSYAFTSIRLPGNIPVDDNGTSLYKGPDTLTTVYVETGPEEIKWTYAWKNGKGYSIIPTLITQTPLDAGTRKSDNKKVTITPSKGSKLWHLELVPDERMKPAPKIQKKDVILLQGKWGKKTILQTITQTTELASLPSY